MDFNKTLESWKKVERLFAAKMLARYPDIEKVEFSEWEFKDRDVKITKGWESKTYELKRDYKSQETGNIALEIKCNGKPSGIFASKADFIIYCLNDDEFYFQSRWELLYRVADIHKYKACGWDGDRAEMYIVEKDLLPMLFYKLN